jgi:His/Glu/Gln/Arg/opine family amino acid ABC transporter permease subunit
VVPRPRGWAAVLIDLLVTHLGVFASGLEATMLIALSAMIGGALLGMLTASLRLSHVGPLRALSLSYIELIRNTPGLVQLMLVYLGLPQFGIRFSPLEATILALTVNNGAYQAEIFRGGLQSVAKGQFEAAAAIGLPRWTTMTEVVLPQAFFAVYPALTNQFIQTILFSSVGALIGAVELTQVALILNTQTYRTIEILADLSLIYIVLSSMIASGSHWLGIRLERRYH